MISRYRLMNTLINQFKADGYKVKTARYKKKYICDVIKYSKNVNIEKVYYCCHGPDRHCDISPIHEKRYVLTSMGMFRPLKNKKVIYAKKDNSCVICMPMRDTDNFDMYIYFNK